MVMTVDGQRVDDHYDLADACRILNARERERRKQRRT
jgi:hypothetical protein